MIIKKIKTKRNDKITAAIFNDYHPEIKTDQYVISALKEIYNSNLSNVNINRNEEKPFLENFDVNISIAHKFNILVIVFYKNPIGVDIEKLNFINFKNIYKYFCKEEIELLESIDLSKNDLFYKIWTEKEAYYKMKNDKSRSLLKVNTLKIENKINFKYLDYYISICFS